MFHCLPVLVAVLLAAGCSSAPTRFYTLMPQASASGPTPASVPYRFALFPVTIPAQVDQPQLVIRQSDDRVALLEGERWISPLGDQIRAVVSDQLQQRLGTADVYGLAHTSGKPVYRIQLHIRRFESVLGSYALISAAWSVHGKGGKHALDCAETVKQPVGSGYSALVRGHQQALRILARHMAVAVQDLASGNDAACP
jgi:uncharacterized lipoprotein YmbA